MRDAEIELDRVDAERDRLAQRHERVFRRMRAIAAMPDDQSDSRIEQDQLPGLPLGVEVRTSVEGKSTRERGRPSGRGESVERPLLA